MNDVEIKLLWTGGWDSTYRLVELSRKNLTVQPVYVIGDNRVSEKYEIKSMNIILELLREKADTKATLLPIMFIDKKSIPPNNDITNAYTKIRKESNLGTQHEWLARLSYLYKGIELGTEKAPLEVSNILRAITMFGKLVKNTERDGFILDPQSSSSEGMLIFGNFVFPIIDKDGSEMLSNISEWGYQDVMKYVWVCHSPIKGEPCGFCHPCELKIETGMDFYCRRMR